MTVQAARLDPAVERLLERETREHPVPPAPARIEDDAGGHTPATLLALQRSAGNQAVGRLLQRVVKVGQPGGQVTEYSQQGQIPALMGTLNARLGALPPWVSALVQQPDQLPELVTGNAPYDFDAAGDIVDWIVLRAVAGGLLKFARDPVPAQGGVAEGGLRFKEVYGLIEKLRSRYAEAGEAAREAKTKKSPFKVFGLTYELEYGGENHYYASREGRTVVYGDFKRMNAKSLLEHLEYSGEEQRFGGKDEHVDNFVCSFLAEPTRWPEEQVFNLLATSKSDSSGTQMVGANVSGTLPMAAGTTWNAEEVEVGRQLPKRALEHARSEGILGLIDARIGNAADIKRLTAWVAKDLGLI